jgi:hypothetical protein
MSYSMLELMENPEECFVCFYETEQFVIFKCSHKVCPTCYPQLRSTLCPVCNREIVIESSPVTFTTTSEFQIEPIIPRNTNPPRVKLSYRVMILVFACGVILLWTKRNVIF